MNQPEIATPSRQPDDAARTRRLRRLAHANAVLSEIAQVGSKMWSGEDGAVARLQITVDGRVFYRDADPKVPAIDLQGSGVGAGGTWPFFPHRPTEAVLLRGLRDYVTGGVKIHRTLLVPRVNGHLARGYTQADLDHVAARLRFIPIFVEDLPGQRS
jgi:hypothetical protein